LRELASTVSNALEDVQQGMLDAARERLRARTVLVHSYDEMKKAMLNASVASRDASWDSDIEGESNMDGSGSHAAVSSIDADAATGLKKGGAGALTPCFFLAPWHDDAGNEAAIKADCKATIRCFPFEHNKQPPAQGVKCFYSGKQATHIALFARAF
jgi:prolyl-tRNA synthetase